MTTCPTSDSLKRGADLTDGGLVRLDGVLGGGVLVVSLTGRVWKVVGDRTVPFSPSMSHQALPLDLCVQGVDRRTERPNLRPTSSTLESSWRFSLGPTEVAQVAQEANLKERRRFEHAKVSHACPALPSVHRESTRAALQSRPIDR